METRKMMLRSKFLTIPTPEEREKGWYKDIWYDLRIKQEGTKFLVKAGDDMAKPSKTLLVFEDFHQFTDKFNIGFKYIL